MLKTIRKTSLRTRLALLAAFAILALLVALFVAWRLARATETFALRQADSAVHNAARDLARELSAHPNGYETIEQALPGPPIREDRKGPVERPRRVPPHVETLFAAYSDPFARLTAITLDRFPNVEGGFYRASDAALIGYTAGTKTPGGPTPISADLLGIVRELASQAVNTRAPAARTSQIGNERVLLVAYPPQSEEAVAAFAMQRISPLSGASDWTNVIALLALALSIIAISGLALVTVRDLRFGVTDIEAGLAGLTTDLSRQISTPDTEELARIAAAINKLATNLRTNIARQAELEEELRQRERLSALGRIVAGVAHEVRNPLAAIKLKVQLADRTSRDPERLNQTFSVISTEIDRLDRLVRRLLELGGQQRPVHTVVDLGELVRNRATFFADLAARANVVIDLDVPAAGLFIEGDLNRLAQVVDNIIQNAIDAMPEGGTLTIRNSTVDSAGSTSVRISFEDTGHGISEEDREHIFEPFFTGRKTGTGLGLAIARTIVEEHGGRLGFINRDGKGATFVIELPSRSAGKSKDN